MGSRYPIHGPMNWHDNTWADNDTTGPWNLTPPTASDTTFCTNAATVLTVTAPEVCGTFIAYGGGRIILADDAGANTCGSITSDGCFLMSGPTIEVTATGQYGTGPFLDISGEASAKMDLGCNLELTGGDLLIVDGFGLATGGDIDTGPYEIIVTGMLQKTGGIVTSCNMILKSNVNSSWNSQAEPLTSIRLYTGYDPRLSSPIFTEKLIVDPGATTHGSQSIRIQAVADDFVDIQGSLGGTGDLWLVLGANLSASGRIVTGDDVLLYIIADATRSLDLSGEVNVPDLEIACSANGQYCSVDLTNRLADIGDVLLGYLSGSGYAKLNLHGTVKVNSIARKTGNTSSLHEVNFNSSQVELRSTITGTNLKVTADADKVHIINPQGGSGRLTNVDPDTQVHAHGCTVDGDCSNISDDTEVYPSSAILMGAGI